MSRIQRIFSLALLAASLLVAPGCITRTVSEVVYREGGVEVRLRGPVKRRQSVSRGFEHPAVIAPQRLARVLSLMEVEVGEEDDRERTSIMAYSMLMPVSRGLAEALEKANDGQEVVVMAVHKKRRRVALFHKLYLTSFIAYVKDRELVVHLSHVNWEVPKNKEDKLPAPRIGDQKRDFRTVPIRGMRRLGPQTIAARWRDPMFGQRLGRKPSDPDQVRKRTILEDSRLPPEALDSEITAEQLEELSPRARQALEDLQIARENGEITEDEYRRARDDLLGVLP